MNSNSPNSIGIFGGSFDPVHCGHVTVVKQLVTQFPWQAFHIIPCKQNTLKTRTPASGTHRLEMLKRAFADFSDIQIDDREIKRATPSHTVETLTSVQQEYPNAKLIFIVGTDAFQHLPDWGGWENLFSLASFLILQRPGCQPHYPDSLMNKIKNAKAQSFEELVTMPYGAYYECPLAEPVILSSSDVRQAFQEKTLDSRLLPDVVLDYIHEHGLYGV